MRIEVESLVWMLNRQVLIQATMLGNRRSKETNKEAFQKGGEERCQ